MTSRLKTFVDQVQSEYADPATAWLIGPEHVYGSQNWPRIVTFVNGGPITPSSIGAQGVEVTGGIDDVVAVRRPVVTMALWAANYDDAENRLHALVIALFKVLGDSSEGIDRINTVWPRAELKDIASGGTLVILKFVTPFDIITSDEGVVADGDAIGAGQDTETVTSATIGILMDDEETPLEIEEP